MWKLGHSLLGFRLLNLLKNNLTKLTRWNWSKKSGFSSVLSQLATNFMKYGNKSQRVKRGLDIFSASMALLVLWPFLIVVSIVIYWRLGSPVVYKAYRVGQNSKVFTMYKFRSMTNACGPDGQLLPDAERITLLGDFLRKSSIDELPSLWNVLIGEVSLVGPRPFSSLYLNRYTPEQNRRHNVPPGITGWSQINGRNSLTWEEKFDFDLWYIDNWNLWLDAKILLRTIFLVFRRKDISHDGFVSAPEFMGTAGNVDSSRDGLPKKHAANPTNINNRTN